VSLLPQILPQKGNTNPTMPCSAFATPQHPAELHLVVEYIECNGRRKIKENMTFYSNECFYVEFFVNFLSSNISKCFFYFQILQIHSYFNPQGSDRLFCNKYLLKMEV